jgi:hypothetical protein
MVFAKVGLTPSSSTLSATTDTAPDAFAKAIEWQAVKSSPTLPSATAIEASQLPNLHAIALIRYLGSETLDQWALAVYERWRYRRISTLKREAAF